MDASTPTPKPELLAAEGEAPPAPEARELLPAAAPERPDWEALARAATEHAIQHARGQARAFVQAGGFVWVVLLELGTPAGVPCAGPFPDLTAAETWAAAGLPPRMG